MTYIHCWACHSLQLQKYRKMWSWHLSSRSYGVSDTMRYILCNHFGGYLYSTDGSWMIDILFALSEINQNCIVETVGLHTTS